LLFQPELESLERRRTQHYAPAALLLAACWAAYQLYPFFTIFSTNRLREGLRWLMASHLSGLQIWESGAEWFAAALALAALTGALRTRWLAAAMLVMPLRLFVPMRELVINELWGAALALAVWSGLPPKLRLNAGVLWIATALLVRELTPFH